MIVASFLALNISTLPFHAVSFSSTFNYISASKKAMEEANILIQKLEGSHEKLENKHISYDKKIKSDNSIIKTNQATIKNLNNEINSLENKNNHTTPIVKPVIAHTYSMSSSTLASYNNIKFKVNFYLINSNNINEFKSDQCLALQELYRTTQDYYWWANYWNKKAIIPPSNWSKSQITSAKSLYSKYGELGNKSEQALITLINTIKSENAKTGSLSIITPEYHSFNHESIDNIKFSTIAPGTSEIYQNRLKNLTPDNADKMLNANILKSQILSYKYAYIYWSIAYHHSNPNLSSSNWNGITTAPHALKLAFSYSQQIIPLTTALQAFLNK